MIEEIQSEFQSILIVESEHFGKVLSLDGFTQSSEIDEKNYHESLVHPAMTIHQNPKNICNKIFFSN